jgi:hypothetical protein
VTSRSLCIAAILCSAACETDALDPQGTYHVTISETTEEPFPSVIQSPVSSDLTLAFDAAGFARLTFLDSPAFAVNQNTDPDDSLHITMATRFPIAVLDPDACPHAENSTGTFFELQFKDHHVHGTAQSVASCLISNNDVAAIFVFDLSGDRAPQ